MTHMTNKYPVIAFRFTLSIAAQRTQTDPTHDIVLSEIFSKR